MTHTPTQQSRDGSGEMFDRIAARYDLLNRVMSLGQDKWWRRQAVRALGLRDGQHILDLATGTADLALAVAARHPSIRVTGLDSSREMLEIGRRKVERRGLGQRVELVIGDAQALAYPDQSFDGLCMAFGIRNLPDRPAALREMARVVRPAGRISLLELSEPSDEIWIAGLARWYLHRMVPFVGALLSGADEYRYLQRSIAAFPPAKEFSRLMFDSGLDVLAVRRLGFGACHLYIATPRKGYP
jgi:demethylmenaquinone methyltransferase / 2-methoxy-6-polyprenyl-1,4-benzoquinol methylase